MKKILSIILLIFGLSIGLAQELNASVTVDYSAVQSSNVQVFQTLQKALRDFINTTKWTEVSFKQNEKIACNFLIIVTEREGNNKFNASIQVQSKRPVYNSDYSSPILNLNDQKFKFSYTEYEALVFNERKFSGKNLTDVISYYVYLILGYDADTFKNQSGTDYFKKAQKIAGNSTNQNYDGWSELDGMRSRMTLVNNILKGDNSTLRSLWYQYHRQGLDLMADKEIIAKNNIGNALITLKFYQSGSFSQFYPLELFIQGKKEEIGKIFNGGLVSSVDINQLQEILNDISPTNSDTWNNLKK